LKIFSRTSSESYRAHRPSGDLYPFFLFSHNRQPKERRYQYRNLLVTLLVSRIDIYIYISMFLKREKKVNVFHWFFSLYVVQ